MNPDRLKERFHLTDAEMQRISDYIKKVETAEIKYCDDHDREWFDFEGNECPVCEKERVEFEWEMRHFWKTKTVFGREITDDRPE